MEKIAIIADVHGNYEALKTVLADIKKRKIKQVGMREVSVHISVGSRIGGCLCPSRDC